MDSSKDAESRPNKRKLQEALLSLDDAVTTTSDRPLKRQNTVKSIYSSLSKYGVKSREERTTSKESPDLSKTPRLAALLARTATRTRKTFPFTRRPTTTATDYRPSSLTSFLARLETYKLNTYSNKPPEIDAVAASKCGWRNDGKDRLKCGLCDAAWVVVGREKMNKDAAASLVKKQQTQLVEGHKDGCPWRAKQCDADIYRIHLLAPTMMAKDVKTRALELDPLLEGAGIKHPLLASQVKSLIRTIESVRLTQPSFHFDTDDMETNQEPPAAPESEPSQEATIAALFGWSLAPPMPLPASTPSRAGTPSISRASSVAPSILATPRRPSMLAPPSASSLLSTPPALGRISSRLFGTPRASAAPENQTKMLYCVLCHRRLGLWASGASSLSPASPAASQMSRQVDVLKEHRPYCPYVTRTANLSALPVSQLPVPAQTFSSVNLGVNAGLTEGWRAVLTVVLRHRSPISQRNSDESTADVFGSTDSGAAHVEESPVDEVDPVQAMVADVKSKGGRELLKYVKGLLR